MKTMKFLSTIVLAIILGTGLFTTSCKKDSTSDKSPTINFIGGSSFISADATLKKDTVFKVGITALSNENSGTKIFSCKITLTVNNVANTIYFHEFINETSFTLNIDTLKVWWPSATLLAVITDKDGETSQVAINLQAKAPVAFNYWTAKILAAQAAAGGSYFSSSTGEVFNQTTVFNNQNILDFVYFYGTTNLATLSAPDDASVGGGTGSEAQLCKTLTTKNPTKFVMTPMTPANFDAANDAANLSSYGPLITESKINNLAVGKVIAFKTVAGKIGIIKVTDIQPGDAGSITISVKVQK